MKKFRQSVIYIFILFFILNYIGCSQENNISKRKLLITPPQQMQDGWSIGSLKEEKIDSVRLLHLLKRIIEKEYPGIDGILIARDGKLVFEEYFQGSDFEYTAKDFKGKPVKYDCNTIHNLASITKSVTAILCGIAYDKKIINSVNDKVYSYFPDDSVFFYDKKKDITLYHLLTMTSGLQWNEQEIGYGDLKNDIVQLFIVSDPLKYILSKPLANNPGTKWYYNGGGTNLIGQMIQRNSRMELDQFAQKYLFDPLEIKESKWVFIKPDFVYASGDLRLRPRDMAKIGSLVLNKGIWNGNRILSSEWVEQMIKKQVALPKEEGYGYQWWLQDYKLGSNKIESYHAAGWGGQWIIILPELDAVIVITGNNYTGQDPTNEMMYNYLLPSIKNDFTYDFGLIEKEAPLPDSINISASENSNQSYISTFLGLWGGQWDSHFLSCQLVVEKIEGDEAVIVYSWAGHPAGYFKQGWLRKKVRIEPSGRIKFEAHDMLDFRLDINEDVVIGNLKNKFVTSKTILKRIK